MIGLYFSGTGNTEHCVTEFVKCFDKNNIAVAIEAPDVGELIAEHDFIVFGSPVYYSNMPKIVRDFIVGNQSFFFNKKVFIISTMGLFSGDGAGCLARILKKYGAIIIGGLQIKMPDCPGDVKLLKKSLARNKEIVEKANKKIHFSAQKLKDGKPTKEGLNIFSHMAGLFGQRLWLNARTSAYKNTPYIDSQKCTGCGRCAALCPLSNIAIVDGKAVAKGRCTMCYRCFSHCPVQALTILGKQVYEQCSFEKYQ